MIKYFERESDRKDLELALGSVVPLMSPFRDFLAEMIGGFVYNDWKMDPSERVGGDIPENYSGRAMTRFVDDETQYYITHTLGKPHCDSHAEYLQARTMVMHNLAVHGINYGLRTSEATNVLPFRTKIWDLEHSA
ncbi:MAG: hypothetical protein AABX11_04130 [Nanoarchaeota archaeon]